MTIAMQSATVEMAYDDEYAEMIDYLRSPEVQVRIAQAQAEIDTGEGIIADDAYFEALKTRRAERMARQQSHWEAKHTKKI